MPRTRGPGGKLFWRGKSRTRANDSRSPTGPVRTRSDLRAPTPGTQCKRSAELNAELVEWEWTVPPRRSDSSRPSCSAPPQMLRAANAALTMLPGSRSCSS